MNIVIIATGKSLDRLKKIEGGDITIAINKAAEEYRHDVAMANDRTMALELLNLTDKPIITKSRHGKNTEPRFNCVPMDIVDKPGFVYTPQLTGVAALDIACKFLNTQYGQHNIYLLGYDHGGQRRYSGPPPCSLYQRPAESFYGRFRGQGHRIYAVNSEKLSKVFLSLSISELEISGNTNQEAINALLSFADGLNHGQ